MEKCIANFPTYSIFTIIPHKTTTLSIHPQMKSTLECAAGIRGLCSLANPGSQINCPFHADQFDANARNERVMENCVDI